MVHLYFYSIFINQVPLVSGIRKDPDGCDKPLGAPKALLFLKGGRHAT